MGWRNPRAVGFDPISVLHRPIELAEVNKADVVHSALYE
jgi:hypothetical protein